VHHMWSYAGMEERWKKREQAWQVDGWGKTVVKVRFASLLTLCMQG